MVQENNQAISLASVAAQNFLKANDIPAEGVTLLGGKIYINGTGLLVKAKKLGMKAVRIEMVKAATKSDLSAIAKATVEMKDGGIFEDMGYCSVESVQMKSLHNADYLTMMAVTRAKNRALRNATGVGLVSAEEVKDAADMYSGENAPTLSLAAPEPKAEEKPQAASAEKLAEIRAMLATLQKTEEGALRHYSGVWSRQLVKLEDLTAGEADAVISQLAPSYEATKRFNAPKEAQNNQATASQPSPAAPEQAEATSAPLEVEVMPEEPKKKTAKQKMLEGIAAGRAKAQEEGKL